MNSITFGKYLPINSYIHRLDPRLKLVSLFMLLISVFFDVGFIGYGIMAILVLIIVKLAKLSFQYILRAVKPMLFMMAFLLIFNMFMFRTGTPLVHIGSFTIYSDGFIQSAYIVIRLLLIISLTTVLTATTKPLDLTLGLEHLFNPLRKVGFPSHEIAMMISIALRFIPTLLDETQRIMKAQASRGVDFAEGTMKEKVRSIVSLIVPLFISAFSRAEELANAMESRCYNPDGKRTRYKQLKWTMNDTLCMIIVCVVSIGLIIFSVVR